MASTGAYEYLIKKYTEDGLLDDRPNKKMWDPFIYPDNGYIPPCEVCKNVYTKYAESNHHETELLWPHFGSGCLWSEFYQNKTTQLNPNVKFKKN